MTPRMRGPESPDGSYSTALASYDNLSLPGSDDVQLVKKKKRASKPKVRTGCLTWIRRVKCGEEKPACLRCTSTGRTCDGYDKGTPARVRGEASLRDDELARTEFLKAYRGNEVLRLLRPIVADIDGSEAEKRYFHRFRNIAAEGLTFHISNSSSFWTSLAPQISHQDAAVKHALIAFGSAYQAFHNAGDLAAIGTSKEQLDVFTLQQYTKAMSLVQKSVTADCVRNMKMTLSCCLIFVCLEMLRNNAKAALTHLSNGLKILQTLPDQNFSKFCDPAFGTWSAQPSAHVDAEMHHIVKLFSRIELTAALYSDEIKPWLALRSYQQHRFTSATPAFETLEEAHASCLGIYQDAQACAFELSTRWRDKAFRTSPAQRAAQAHLLARCRQWRARHADFMASPRAPAAGSPDDFCARLDYVHFLCTLVGVMSAEAHNAHTQESAPSSSSSSQSPSSSAPSSSATGTAAPGGRTQDDDDDDDDDDRCPIFSKGPEAMHAEILARCEELLAHPGAPARLGDARRPRYTWDGGVLGVLYFMAINADDPALRGRAARMLRACAHREAFWDGRELARLVRHVGGLADQQRWPYADVPRGLSGTGSIPDINAILESMGGLSVA